MLGADLACLDGRFGRSLRECQRRREESESRALEKASSRRGDHGRIVDRPVNYGNAKRHLIREKFMPTVSHDKDPRGGLFRSPQLFSDVELGRRRFDEAGSASCH